MRLLEALRPFDERLLQFPEGRRELTKHDPLLFAAVYLPHKLKFVGSDEITLNRFHLDIIEYGKGWSKPLTTPRASRDTFIAPRQTGKSTWIFHILPIWAAAHGHKKYIIAFSDNDTQAQGWLLNFKMELDRNPLLQEDYPDLCATDKGGSASNRALMDNRNATKRANGFIFQAKGADANVLGANVDGRRPEVMLFDDIEPPEGNYGPTEMTKRKNLLLQSHFYLNTWAIVAFVGTTTAPDSIIDQMRKVEDARKEWDGPTEQFRESLDPEIRWVVDENIKTHYYPAIENYGTDSEFSLWPEVWPMSELNEMRHTRTFAMNMMNRPISLDGGYWGDDDIEVESLEEYGNTILSVDPAVTTAKRSDYTGLAIVSRGADGKVYVRHAEQVKKNSDALTEHVTMLINKYNAKVVYVETNQGGDLWKQVFKGIPAKLRTMRQREKKEVRAAAAFDYYRKGMVKHTGHFPTLEEQMLAFPRVPHDDVLDAVVSGVLYFKRGTGNKVVARQLNYMEVA